MFYWKIEGQAPRNGLNVYRLDDERSAGFIIKAFGKKLLRVRYSKLRKCFFF